MAHNSELVLTETFRPRGPAAKESDQVSAIRWNGHSINNSIIFHCPLVLYEMQRLKGFREGIHQRCFVPRQFAKRVLVPTILDQS